MTIRFPMALLLAALSGFISLSYEILWFRIYCFVSAGTSASFALLLGFYLVGLAIGAFISRHYCRSVQNPEAPVHLRALTAFVLFANGIGFLVIPAIAGAVKYVNHLWTFSAIVVAGTLLGAAFPLISHFAIRNPEKAGVQLSYLYLANIIGSAAGSFLTGFWFMEYFSTFQIALFLILIGLGLGSVLLLYTKLSPARMLSAMVAIGGAGVLAVGTGPVLFDGLFERLLQKREYTEDFRFAHLVENRSGVIAVTEDGVLYGGGIYDGTYSVDLINDRNSIIRPFSMGAFHPAPEEVLSIGLGSGSWALALANHPSVRKLTIVEINPGYVDLLSLYPDHASLIHNPKVEIIIDDGRRWLRRNPDRKFDAIVCNSTFNWRMHATNLLSVEFLELIRQHMKGGAVYIYNATYSSEVLRTGATVFPYAWRFSTCIAVSDQPFHFDMQRWRRLLETYTINGNPIFDLSREASRKDLEGVLRKAKENLESRDSILARTSGKRLVTDDNMGTEWYRLRQYLD